MLDKSVVPVANEESYFLPRKAGLRQILLGGPLLGAVLPNSFRLFPGAVFLEVHFAVTTLAGGVGNGYFLSRSARVRIPPGTLEFQ